ncbi:MAG TPA: transcription-repair coupling factor, partial [Anaerolineae bacterium]|nr:transcription-repair coupling factor [Anaerolineae bacterium]
GHIAAVGFDLYCKLLAQAVQKLKEGTKGTEGEIPSVPSAPLAPSVSIDLPLAAFIPEDYVADPTLRLRLYRRMAGLTTLEEVEGMARELEDRFGKLPRPVANLIYQLRLKVLALKAGVQAISQEDRRIVIKVEGLRAPDLGKLRRRLGPKLRVGQGRIWLTLSAREEVWQGELMEVLESLKKAVS